MQNYRVFDLKRLLLILRKKAWLILLVTVIFGVTALIVTKYYITPEYTASIKLYVNNTTEANKDITSSDITASQSLVGTYIAIIQSDAVLDQVIRKLGLNYSAEQINEMLTASDINQTEVFKVFITSKSPQEAASIANAIADIAPNKISEIVRGSSVKIIDRAKVPVEKNSSSFFLNIAIGVMLGFILTVAIILLAELLDTRIKEEEDLEFLFKLPVLGSITDFNQANKGCYGYGYKVECKENK